MQASPVFSFRRRVALASLLAAGALALAGCAALQPVTPESIVTQRVEQRWAALIDGNLEKAWEFAQPGFRAIVKQKDYRKRYFTINTDNEQQKEIDRMYWLHRENIITESELDFILDEIKIKFL